MIEIRFEWNLANFWRTTGSKRNF